MNDSPNNDIFNKNLFHNINNNFDESSSEDENNKLPEFANAANKRLNEIINRYRKEIKVIQKEINEDNKILKILKDHKESVESQVETRDKMEKYI